MLRERTRETKEYDIGLFEYIHRLKDRVFVALPAKEAFLVYETRCY